MTNIVALLIQQVLIMFLLAAVGYLCFRTKKITMEGNRNLSNILLYLSLPSVIINSFLVEFSREKLLGLLFSFLAAAVVLTISILVSRLIFHKDPICHFASSFSNPGFFGIPLIVATLSDGAVFYIAPFIAMVNLLQWTYGVAQLTKEEGKTARNRGLPLIKRLFTAPFMIATLIGLFFFFTGLPMPQLLGKGIQYISGLNTPLAMFTIGIYLAQTNLVKMLCKPKLYLLAAVRLLLIPALSLLVLWLLPAEFSELKMALLIVSACPVGSGVAMYAQLHNSDYSYAVETVVISTLLSIVSIPLIVQVAGILNFY